MIGELLVAVAILFVALSIVRSGGWYWRLSEEALLLMRNPTKFHETQYGGAGYRENTMITLGDATKPPQFLIFGDSFAAQYAAGLDSFLKSHGRSAQLYFLNGCLIMPHVTGHAPGNVNPACNEAFYTVRQLVREKQLPVIHAQSWGSFKDHSSVRDGDAITFPKERNQEYYAFIIEAIHASRQAFGTPFAFTGISPGLNETNVSRCSEMPAWLSGYCQSDVSVPEGERLNGQEFNTAAQAYVTANPGALFLNPRSALCQNGFCYAMRGSQAYYSDYSHFTKAGALLVLNYYATPLLSFGAR
jgi:hypothetical protein